MSRLVFSQLSEKIKISGVKFLSKSLLKTSQVNKKTLKLKKNKKLSSNFKIFSFSKFLVNLTVF